MSVRAAAAGLACALVGDLTGTGRASAAEVEVVIDLPHTATSSLCRGSRVEIAGHVEANRASVRQIGAEGISGNSRSGMTKFRMLADGIHFEGVLFTNPGWNRIRIYALTSEDDVVWKDFAFMNCPRGQFAFAADSGQESA